MQNSPNSQYELVNRIEGFFGIMIIFHILNSVIYTINIIITMSIQIKRKLTHFLPDPSRVIVRFFIPGGTERAKKIIRRIMELPESNALQLLNQILRDFSSRHRNITRIFLKHYEKVEELINLLGYGAENLAMERRLLIGAYFSLEYSIESAAFFNPSIVEDPDQSHLPVDHKRVIVSFRATGEGHISSIVFRNGILDADGNFAFNSPGKFVDEAETIQIHLYDRQLFINSIKDMGYGHQEMIDWIFSRLEDTFTLQDLERSIHQYELEKEPDETERSMAHTLKWMADAQYLVSFSLDSMISERVIFPVTESESKGIEDARFVKFGEEGDPPKYFATYTAYNGRSIMPQMIETIDFCTFKIMPIYGKYAKNKGLALFPKKIDGKYVMLARVDGENNYLLFSDQVNIWDQEPYLLQEPEYPWEFVQLGNSGSPVETEKGWLVITHGVGPMRRYCLGAILLDLHDPRKIIGKLSEPLLVANEEEREGYVPNVVYSCGALIHHGELIIPYAMSDTRSGFAGISVPELLQHMLAGGGGDNVKGRKVLIVEDDPFSQNLIRPILERAGYTTEVAADGLQALVEIGRCSYDLILSDVNMPNFSGYQLLQFMKNKKINVPVFLLSGNCSREDELKGLELGAVDYLRKPLDPELLLLKLSKLRI